MSATNSRVLAASTGKREHHDAFASLYAASHADEVGLTLEEFVGVLQEISRRYLPPNADRREQVRFCGALQLEELALARACAKGSAPAWDRFVERYRAKLRNAARAITRDESQARELADSLYADLFGMRQKAEAGRSSKLASYTGRGSLEGWLRTVLAQEYVNQIRCERRFVSFDERIRERKAAQAAEVARPIDGRIEQAIDAALEALSAEERVVLASYYLDNRTLAEIARMLRLHESTVSRRLDKITSGLRKLTMRRLRQSGMSAREAAEAMQSDVRDLNLDIRSRLAGKSTGARSAN